MKKCFYRLFATLLLLWSGSVAAGAALTQPSVEEKSLGKLSDYDKIKVIVVSSDGLHVAFVGVRGKQQWVVRDGVQSPPYDWVIPASLAMSPDGMRYSYITQNSAKTFPVVDGTPGAPCYAIAGNRIIFTKDGKRFAYVAQLGDIGKGAQLVTDQSTGPVYDSIDSPMFSVDGAHLAYRAARGKQQFVVLDGKPQKPVEGVIDATMVFSPDGKHLTYGVHDAGATHIVLDDVESTAYDKVLVGPGFSAEGSHLATVIIRGEKTYVVLDGRLQLPFDGLVAGNLTFSPDGNHLAYGVKRGEQSTVVVDGVPRETFDQLANSTLHYSKDSQHLTYEAVSKGKSFIMDDDVKLDAFEGGLVNTPIFSPDATRLLFGCRREGKWLIVVWDGKQRTEIGPFDAVALPGFSPDGKRVAFRVIDKGKYYADIDNVLSPDLEAVGQIVFSPDSKHFVYFARRTGHSHLVIDGVESQQEFDARLSGERPDFDGNNSLHVLTLRDKEIFLEKLTLK